jgi:hypothetical protein
MNRRSKQPAQHTQPEFNAENVRELMPSHGRQQRTENFYQRIKGECMQTVVSAARDDMTSCIYNVDALNFDSIDLDMVHEARNRLLNFLSVNDFLVHTEDDSELCLDISWATDSTEGARVKPRRRRAQNTQSKQQSTNHVRPIYRVPQ